jgi:O-methyltransferase
VAAHRLRDLLTLAAAPGLRRWVHRGRDLGLTTLLDYQRLAFLVAAVRLTRGVDGDIVECGTYCGGSAAVLGQAASDGRTLWVFDSFQGMPETVAADNFHARGDFGDTSVAAVQAALGRLRVRCRVVPGFFSETLGQLPGRISMAHIDCDLYEAVRDCLQAVRERMAPGGVIVLDDYGAPTCAGARQATDEFLAATGEVLHPLCGPQHAIWAGRAGNLRRALIRQLGATASLVLRAF